MDSLLDAEDRSPADPDSPEAGRELVTALLVRSRRELLAWLLSAVRRPHDAEDLLQEVFLVATRRWAQFQPGTNFRAWVGEIARRCVLKFARSRRLDPALFDPDVLERLEEAALEVEAEDPLAPRAEALRECLKLLAGRARMAVELRYGERLGVADVARSLGKSLQATYSLLRRTRDVLHHCIRRRLHGEPLGMDPQ